MLRVIPRARGRFYNHLVLRDPAEKDDFTSSYRGNAVEDGARAPTVSTGKWLENDAAKFLPS